MTILIDQATATANSLAGTSNNPLVMYQNITVTATYSTTFGTEVEAAALAGTGTTFDSWIVTPSSNAATLQVAFPSDQTLSFAAIAAHNIGTIGGTVLFQFESVSVTNLAIRSEELNFGADWVLTNASVVTNPDIAPDGGLKAESIVPDATNAEHKIVQNVGALTSGRRYWLSVYGKADGYNFIRISGENTAFAGSDYAVFDLSAGTVGITNLVDEAFIEDVGNGWHRCAILIPAETAASGNIAAYVN